MKSWVGLVGWAIADGLPIGHPSATGRAQDRESSPAKDQRYTIVPRNQPHNRHNQRHIVAKSAGYLEKSTLIYSLI